MPVIKICEGLSEGRGINLSDYRRIGRLCQGREGEGWRLNGADFNSHNQSWKDRLMKLKLMA